MIRVKQEAKFIVARMWNCFSQVRERSAFLADGVYKVPILYYHSVWDSKGQGGFRVSVNNFERQVAYLTEHYKVVSMGHLFDSISKGKPLDNAAVVTFDDGYEDNFSNALPILEKYQCPATIFIVTGFVNGEIELVEDGEVLRPLTWSQIKEMHSSGLVTFGGHTHTHRMLTDLSLADVKTEVKDCKSILEEKLQQPIEHFCYPNGNYNSEIADIVKESGYLSACSTVQGIYNSSDKMFWLNRIIMDGGDTIERFKLRLNGAYDYLNFARRVKGLVNREVGC